MKLPRVSIHALMAAVFVIALDCMIFRAVAVRPEYLTRSLAIVLLASMPMVHVLAIGAAILARGPILRRRFLLGFEVFGLLAVAVTSVRQESFLRGLEWAALRMPRVAAWLNSLPLSAVEVLSYVIPVGFFFLIQLVVGSVGGLLVLWFGPRQASAPSTGDVPARWRLVPSLIVAGVIAIPAIATEGYVRLVVDPKSARYEVGSTAIVDLQSTIHTLGAVPAGTPLSTLGGARVRIESDAEPYMVQLFVTHQNGEPVEEATDLRNISVQVLDGDQVGMTHMVPHCYLRPAR